MRTLIDGLRVPLLFIKNEISKSDRALFHDLLLINYPQQVNNKCINNSVTH